MLSPAAQTEVAASVDEKRDKDRHRGELVALLLALLGIYGGHVYAEIGVTPPTASLSEISWAQGRAASLLDVVNATTRRQLLQALSEAKPGEDLDATLARIDKVFDRAETLRAPIIGDSTATALGGFAAYNVALHTGIQRVIWTTMRDQLVRDSHVVLDGQARHPGELFTSGLGNQAYYPGAFGEAADDCNCFPADTMVAGKIVAGLKAFYAGKMVDLETRSGRRLTVTPNHPVLTASGMVKASGIREGDCLVRYAGGREPAEAPRVKQNVEDMPAPAEDIFSALGTPQSALLRDLALVDLYGDASSVKGDIEIVALDRHLQFDGMAVPGDRIGNDLLEPPNGLGAGRGCSHDGLVPSRAASGSGPSAGKLALDRGTITPGPFEFLRSGAPAQFDASLLHAKSEDGTVDAAVVGEFLHAHAMLVELDQVVEIRDVDFSGHVYDFQAENGLLIAGGFLVSNCRCWLEVELADNDKAAPQRRLELADARESIRQLAAQQIIGRMLAIFRDQRARVIAAARRLDV